ncbi:hypothetical protein TCAL_10269 [Tigriopus californicus]|uniref:AB hydrolase-1 domain-containing protein n=1 Tax=Tigriopus californicus TaxID=6832 RepID=A0A553PQ51_TIGCA|nr:hypothetical protein TCAL_10269 [Tigriopus californicus]
MSDAEKNSVAAMLTPGPPGAHHHVVPTERCGALNVFIEGDLEEAHRDKDSKCVFLTVHDLGCNHESIQKFTDHPGFEEIKKRAILVHVDMPGHEPGATDLPENFTFPTIQHLGEDLVTVLDQLRIKYVIGIGDGAGANVMARFAMMHSQRCLGVILIHPTSNKTKMMDTFKDKIGKWKVNNLTPTVENMTVFRRFGHKLEDADNKEGALEEFKKQMGRALNKKNMAMYANAYSNRKDITPLLSKTLRCDALLLAGSKTANSKTSLLKIDDVGNVLDEAPVKTANSILLFCKGLGWLTSVDLPGVERRSSIDSQGKPRRQRSISMEDYDKPNIRRLSISSGSNN